jgi:hypothetical protein
VARRLAGRPVSSIQAAAVIRGYFSTDH